MPLNLSDEALDAFDSLDDNDKSGLLDELDDNDVSSLTDAVLSFRERKQKNQFVNNQISGYESPSQQMSVGNPATIEVPKQEPSLLGKIFSKENFMEAIQPPGMPTPGKVQEFKETKIDPAVRSFQQNYGAPAADAIMSTYNKAEDITQAFNKMVGVPQLTPEERAAHNLLGYEALSFLGGPDLVEKKLTESQRLTGTNSLIDSYGETGAAFAQSLASELHQLPMVLYGNLGAAKKGMQVADTVIKNAPNMSKIAQVAIRSLASGAANAVEGAVINTATGVLTPGKNLQDASLEGLLGGFGGGVAGQAGGELVQGVAKKGSEIVKKVAPVVKKKARVLAVATRVAVADIAGEIQTVAGKLPAVPARKAPGVDIDGVNPEITVSPKDSVDNVIAVKATDPEFKPGFSTVGVGPDGKLKGFLTELSPDGKHMKVATVPLETLDDRLAHGRMVQKHGMAVSIPSKEAINHPDYNPSFLMDIAPAKNQPAPTWDYGQDLDGPKTVYGGTPGKMKASIRPPDLDGAYADTYVRPAAVIQDVDGRIKLQPMESPKPVTAPIEAGEAVEVKTAVGRINARVKEVRGNTVVLKTPAGDVEVPEALVLRKKVGGGAGAPPSGQEVYVGRGTGDSLQRGELVGHDLSNRENLLIKMQDGWEQSVPAKDIFRLQMPKDLVPEKAPSDGLPLDPAGVGPTAADEVNTIFRLATYAQGNKGIVDAFDKAFMNPAVYGWAHAPKDAAEALLLNQGIREVGAHDEVYKVLRQQFKNHDEFGAFARDLNNAGLGKMSLDELWAKYPDASTHSKNFVKKTLEEIDANDKAIAALGGVPEDYSVLRDAGEMDKYLVKLYNAHFLGPDEWAKRAPVKVWQDAIDWMQKEYPHLYKQEIAHELRGILRIGSDETSRRAAFFESSLGSKWKNLEARKHLPPQIEKLLGGVDSGFIRIAMTVSNQRAIKANLQLWKEISENRTLWSPGPQITDAGEWIPLEPNKSKYGAAAGGYVSPHLAPIVNVPQAAESAFSFLQSITGWRKGNLTLFGGPRIWFSNVMRNLKGAVLSGGLDIFRPVQSGQAMVKTVKDLASWRKLPVNTNSEHPITMWRRLGVDTGGFAQNELKGKKGEIIRALEKSLSETGDRTNLWDFFDHAKNAVTKFATNKTSMHEALYTAYDYIDRVAKIASANALHKKFMSQGMSFEEAAREAAFRIKAAFPDFSNVGPLIEKSRRSAAVGAVSPFLSGHAENIRVNRMLPILMKRDPELKFRLLGTGAFLGALYGANRGLRHLNGITDEEVQAAVDDQKLSKQRFRQGVTVAPWRDAKGRVELYDMSSWFDDLPLLQGDVQDPWYTNVMTNLLSMSLGETAEPVLQNIFEMAGTRYPSASTPPMLEGNKGGGAVLKMLYDSGFAGPTYPGKVAETLRRGEVIGNLGRTEEQLTPAQMAAKIGGAPLVAPYTLPGQGQQSPSHLGAVKDFPALEAQFRAKMNMIGASTRSHEEKQRLFKAEIEAFKQRLNIIKQNQQSVRKAQDSRQQKR